MLTTANLKSQPFRWKWACCFFLLVSCLMWLLPQVQAAELNVRFFDGRIIDSSLEGEVRAGDYDRFVTQIQNGGLGSELWLNSPGGDAVEAMKIGRLIRDLRMDTQAPDRIGGSRPMCLGHPPSGPDLGKCDCSSACFLIFVAGINRHGNVLGVHRVYPSHDRLKFMTPDDAAIVSEKVNTAVSSYLLEMGVPTHFVERLMAIPSNKIEWVTAEDIDRYFSGYIPQYSEWVAAKCKEDPALWDEEAMSLYKRNKTQRLSAEEEQKLSDLINAVEAEARCNVNAAREIRRDAEAKVVAKLKSVK